MNEIDSKNIDFKIIYQKSYKLTAAVFMVSNLMDKNEELGIKIKNLSLKLVSMSVNLKDINFFDTQKLINDLEKVSLELMSMLDIASVSSLISKMNGDILKEEFQSFISSLANFSEVSEGKNGVSVKSVLNESVTPKISDNILIKNENNNIDFQSRNLGSLVSGQTKIANGHKRKDLRKNMILDFIKGHNEVSIKDIVPNITGCSEKTVQRELMLLINEGKIKKMGERRWSRYSIV